MSFAARLSKISLALLAAGLSFDLAHADVAPPVADPKGWPAWLIVLIAFTLLIGLIVVLARFIGKGSGDDSGGSNDGGGLLGS